MNPSGKPTYKRQRYLLAFISQLPDNGIKKTYLQKLVFLDMMNSGANYYDFVPYRFGPYSFQLAEDIDILKRDGFLVRGDNGLRAKIDQQVDMCFSIPTERGDALLQKAYRAYPYYTINSEILSRLFAPSEVKRFIREREQFHRTEEVLFTIGYEGYSIEAFINTLIRNNVRLLCDVRKNSISRKFGFSKSKLQYVTETIGIKYYHVPELGIESEKRAGLSCMNDYEDLFADYAETLSEKEQHLIKVYDLLKKNGRIALMCYEKEPQMCHRHVIRDYIAEHYPIRSADL